MTLGSANSQSVENLLITKNCTISCGIEFNYNSKIVITNDTINIFQPTKDIETIMNQYVIVNKKEKWKTPNYHGTTKYKVVQVSDQSKKNIQLVLRHGKGTVSISENGECEITLGVEANLPDKMSKQSQ